MRILFLILLLLPLTIIGFQQDAFAVVTGMSLTAEASEGSDFILVRGQTASQVTDVMLSVTTPDGFNKVALDQLTPDANGTFATIFKISAVWKQNGFYTITAMQSVDDNSLYTISVEVEVINRQASETLVTESNLETGIFVPDEEQLTRKGLVIFVDTIDDSTLKILGFTDRTNMEITLKIIAPNGNVVFVEEITPSLDGEITREISTRAFVQDGIYTITAQQGESSEYKDSENVEIVDGIVLDGSNSVPQIDPPSDESQKIPEWVKNTMKWFVEGKISEDEMINALQFLIREGIIRV